MPQIEDMDFKELREEVQRLRDELARMKRTYEDVLCNLDDDNFSGVYRKKTKDMESAVEQTADKIKMTVSKTLSFGDAIQTVVHPSAITDAETDRLYYYTGNAFEGKGYYYYNDITEEWERTSDKSIYSAFVQTASGFKFDAKVVNISGDLITEGTITGTNFIRTNDNVISPIRTSISASGISVDDTRSSMVDGEIIDWLGTTTMISPDGVTLYDGNINPCASLSRGGLQFWESLGVNNESKLQGWQIDTSVQPYGVMRYYASGVEKARLGIIDTHMKLMLINQEYPGYVNDLVIDLEGGDSRALRFENIEKNLNGEPNITANGKLLATQEWVAKAINSGTSLG